MLNISNTTVKYSGEVPFTIDPISQKNYSELNIITHAHSDHIKISKNGRYNAFIAHPATIELLKQGLEFDANFIPSEYNKPIKLNGNTITLLNSGHILGSSAILIENNKIRFAITGDINTTETNISKPIKPIEDLDFMIIESTYGLEKYQFPKRQDGYSQINNWVKQAIHNNNMPVIITHRLGKTQEIVKELNKNNSGYIALPSETIDSNEVYNLYGKKLKNMLPLEEVRDANCVVLPPSKYNQEMINYISFISGKKADYLHVTGHNLKNCVNLSSHSDYKGLLSFIDASKPKMVYTYHGHSENLAKSIEKELGIKSKVANEINTNTL